MRLTLVGHEYRYAAEQILLTMFPEERPEYAGPEPGVSSAVISLHRGASFSSAVTVLRDGAGGRWTGSARVKNEALTDRLVTDRLLQKCVRLSFYRAAVRMTGRRPVWGALTGIRPGRLVTNLLAEGRTERQAVRAMVRDQYVSPERAALCLDTARASLRANRLLRPEDICLYVGIPFCPTRCAYCSFVSNSVERSLSLVEPFLETLAQEIEHDAALVRRLGLRIVSVYFGGGTPTTLTAPQLDRLMGQLSDAFDLSCVSEYTVEAGRPDTITPEKLAVLKRRGVTRVSVNPQTMRDEVLAAIGRRHTAGYVAAAMAMVRDAGIPSVNMDLIAGLPADTADGFRESLDRVLSFRPENVTVHTLALKKGSRITLEGTPLPDEAAVGAMLDYAASTLSGTGFRPYYLYRQKYMSGGFENVGWSLPGYDSLYNICIMEELCTILSLGGGGSTKLVNAAEGRIERVFNPKYPREYIEGLDKIREKKKAVAAFYGQAAGQR